MTRLEEELTRSLRSHAEEVDWPAGSLEDVRRSAVRIRRRRRVTSGAVAAAVLAIAVPAGVLLAGDGAVGPDRNDVAASDGPSASSSPTTPLEVTLRTDVAIGGEPRIPYMYDGQIVLEDGSAIDVGRQLSHVTPYRDGWMGLFRDRGVPTAMVVDGDGTEVKRFVSGPMLATDIGHTHTAYVHRFDSGGTLNLDGPRAGDRWAFAEDSNWQPVGILGSDTVVYDDDSVDPVAMLAEPAGTRPILGLQWAMGVSTDGLVSGRVSLDEQKGKACYAVMDAATSTTQFKTCEYSLWRFSPDARYVFGHQPVYDGNFVGQSVAILDAHSGRPVVEYAAEDTSGPWIRDVAWEDATHLLATVYEGEDRWYVLRLGVDGTIENVTRTPLPGGELDSPVLFSARP